MLTQQTPACPECGMGAVVPLAVSGDPRHYPPAGYSMLDACHFAALKCGACGRGFMAKDRREAEQAWVSWAEFEMQCRKGEA